MRFITLGFRQSFSSTSTLNNMKPKKLFPGLKIMVYQKPLTDEDFEGRATLFTRADKYTDSAGNERWKVVFDNETESYSRIVHARNLCDLPK